MEEITKKLKKMVKHRKTQKVVIKMGTVRQYERSTPGSFEDGSVF